MSRLHKLIHHPITARFLVALLIAWGLANVCITSFFPVPDLGKAFLWCALFVVLFALFSAIRFRLKWLVLLTAVGSIAALGIWGHKGPAHSLAEGVKAFIYAGQGWPEVLALYADRLLPFLCLILSIAAQGAAADESSLTAGLYSLASCVIFFQIHPQPNMLWVALPAFAGFALQLSRKQKFHILALPIAALLVLLAYFLTPQTPSTSPTLEKTARDVRYAIEDHLLFTSQRDSFSLATEGYMPLETRLGGKPTLSDRPVMDVETDQTLLLRGKTYDLYTGISWGDSISAKRYLFNSVYNRELRNRLFSMDMPMTALSNLPQKTLQVRLLSDGTTTLFLPAYTREITMQSPRMVPYFNSAAELFLTRNTTDTDRYTLTYLPLQAGDAESARIVAACAQVQDPGYALAASQYLTVPDHILNTPEMVELAAQAADENASPYDKALQIQAFLQSNYPYSLDVSTPGERVDFVSYFLLAEKKGYCTYFASAMTILCRMHGIPARYVTGYLAEPGEDGIAHVQGRNAHAWTEIYLNGVGWLPIDATGLSASNGEGQQPPPAGSNTPKPTPQPTATPRPTQAPTSQPSSSPSNAPQHSPSPSQQPTAQPIPTPSPQEEDVPDTDAPAFDAWWLLALLLLLAIIALWYYLSLPETRAKRKKADAAAIYFKATEKILAGKHVRRLPSQTLLTLARQAEDAGYPEAAQAAQAYNAHIYGKSPLPAEVFQTPYKTLFSRLTLPQKIIFRLKGMFGR